jgi:hypothetical protein
MMMKRGIKWGVGAIAGSLLFSFAEAAVGADEATTVSSLSELQPYLDDSHVRVVMAPGIYRITPEDVTSGRFPNPTLLSFSGTNSVFDFTGVTIEVETEVFRAFGKTEVKEVAVWGDHLVLKNLTLTDIGNASPLFRAQNVTLDGRDNRVEGFNITVRGAFPYGYGDMFGKGGNSVINHRKHSAILVRGDRSHLFNCKVYHRSYGHAIFTQGALDAVIEGCYVEGLMRSTDDVLAEAGTGSPADQVDFMTVWGWKVPPGSMFSCLEEGIRAYDGGQDPEGNKRGTINLTVKDCTVKNARGGVSIGWSAGTKRIENCVTIGCEGAYWPGSGKIIESCGNAPYAPLLLYFFENRGGSVVDLTLVDHEGRVGNDEIAYIIGNGHDITIRSRDGYVDPDMKIMLGGVRGGHREVEPGAYNDLKCSNNTLNNTSLYPVELSGKSSGNTVTSAGTVKKKGSGNKVESTAGGTTGGFAVLQTVRGEDYSELSGVKGLKGGEAGVKVGDIQNGDWLRFDDFFFGSGPNRFEARVANATGGSIELRLDGVDGELIGTCPVPASAESNTWETVALSLDEPRGKHDVFLVFKGESESLMELDAFKFDVLFPGHEPRAWDAPTLVGHWTFDEESGTSALDSIHDQITVAMWVHGGKSLPAAGSVLRAKDADGNQVLNIQIPDGDSNVRWKTGFKAGVEQIVKKAAVADVKGSWTHWVFSKDTRFAGGLMKIYRNGKLWYGESGKGQPISDIAEVAIGSGINEGFYTGALDDVRLYNVALSAKAVADLYHHGRAE